ncbi:MAG: hypothetical protein KKB34_09635 [Bacteroidetes bacterium]|nr:hypothetical protein [Bacteroidota bacterium]
MMKSFSKSFVLILFVLLCKAVYSQDIPDFPEIAEPAAPLYPSMQLSEKEENEYLKNISEPVKAQLKIIKENNKNRYHDFLREYYYRNMKFPALHRSEKQMRQNEKDVIENEILLESLAIKYKKSKAGEKEKIKNDLEKSLNKLFDLKEGLRENEVKELEKRLQELKEKLNIRQKNKSTIIRRRIDELLGDDKYLDWD